MKDKSKAGIAPFLRAVNTLSSIVKRNIRAQYRRSALGVLWTVLNPLLNMAVMAIVFSEIFARDLEGQNYPVYVLCGNVIFNLMRASTVGALPSLVDNYDLMNKTRVPQYVFPVSHALSAAVNFAFSFIALLAVMTVFSLGFSHNVTFYPTILMVIPFIPSLILFSAGLALILSVLYVRFRDIKHLYGVFITLWTYLTPLFYVVTRLPSWVQGIMQFNPMYHYVTYFRTIIMLGEVPTLKAHLICYGAGILFFTVGALIFKKVKGKILLYI